VNLGFSDFDGEPEEDVLKGLFDKFELGESDIEPTISFDEFKRKGLQRYGEKPYYAFKEEIEDPDSYPFLTGTGKIEIYSKELEKVNCDVEDFSSVYPSYGQVPKIPTYIECTESPTPDNMVKYPLQLTSPHHTHRTHSQFFNIPRYRSLYRHEVWLNPVDAESRGIKQGDLVHIYNDRGTIQMLAKVTTRMMPGVIRCYQGGWFDPDENGIDLGGCANVLLDDTLGSPAGTSNCNTCLVEIKRAM
jgi:anaerobic dimethyl sulfoxide reductase subunit A